VCVVECTFILIDLETREAGVARLETVAREEDLVSGMCGDVNLFLNDHDDRRAAEIEIMVAEIQSRRKGLGRQALILMMHYGLQHLPPETTPPETIPLKPCTPLFVGVRELGLHRFVSKISLVNGASISLFKSLRFEEESVSAVFQEVTLQLVITPEVATWLDSLAAGREIHTFSRE